MRVEAKRAEVRPERSLHSLKRRFPEAEAWQVTAEEAKDFLGPEGIRVAPASVFLAALV